MATPSVAGLRQVRSICLSSDGTKVLVGTLGSDILELATVEKPSGGDDGEEEEEVSLLCRTKHHMPQYCFPQSRQHKDYVLCHLFNFEVHPSTLCVQVDLRRSSNPRYHAKSMSSLPSNEAVTRTY